jgi:membrane protein implicated in regulation of membrane protease activity
MEILTVSLIFLSLAIAALVGALASAVWTGSIVQWLGFAIAAVLTLGFLRPFARKYLFKKGDDAKTGMAALLSQKAMTLSEVNSTTGSVRLRNETWTARSKTGIIPTGVEVEVVRIDGAVAIVAPITEPSES